MKSFRRLFGNRGLRLVLGAQIPADFADWLDFVAISALLAFVWEADPLAFAWLAAAFGLPYLVVGPIAGTLVDRADLKRVMILSNVGRAVTTAALAFAGNVPVLLAIVFLRGCVDSFFSPARQSAIQVLAPAEDLMAANGAGHAINQASKIAGPAIGGALLLLLAPQQVFLMNAGVSLVAALILFGLHRDLRPAREPAARRNVLHELAQGVGELRGKPVLVVGIGLMAAGFFAMFFYDTLIPLLTKSLSFDETVFGLAIAAVGAGGVLGSLALGLWAGGGRPFLWVAAGYAISGALVLPLGLLAHRGMGLQDVLFVALFGLLGLATSAIVVPFRTIIQQHAAPEKIARVSSLSEAANTAALLIAPFIGAAIARATSIGLSFIIGGALMLCLGVAALVAAMKLRGR